jgi:hypothetical protein
MGRFSYLMWRIFLKKLNENRNIDRLNIRVAGFVMIGARFVIKIRGEGVVFCIKKKRWGRERKRGRVNSYNFNIIDEFTDEN